MKKEHLGKGQSRTQCWGKPKELRGVRGRKRISAKVPNFFRRKVQRRLREIKKTGGVLSHRKESLT